MRLLPGAPGTTPISLRNCWSRLPPTWESDEALDNWLLRNVTTSQPHRRHRKMGPDGDPMAVVDQQCRVKGLEGLRVIDASVMPDCIRANTNCTTIMIAERMADRIRQAGNRPCVSAPSCFR